MRELTKTKKAVIDRIVDGRIAVVLVDDEEYKYPAEKLPEGAGEGVWLQIRINEREITSVSIDQKETEKVRKRIGVKMEKLRKRGHKV